MHQLKQIPLPNIVNINLIPINKIKWTPDIDVKTLIFFSQKTIGDKLEIGCNEGLTTLELAKANPHNKIIGIDYIGSDDTMVTEQKYEKPKIIGKYAKSIKNVIINNINSKDFQYNKYPNIDFIFIDGDHSYEGVKNDTLKAVKHIHTKKHGIIMWHDYNPTHPEWVKVKTFLDEFAEESKLPIFSITNTWLAIYEFKG